MLKGYQTKIFAMPLYLIIGLVILIFFLGLLAITGKIDLSGVGGEKDIFGILKVLLDK